MKMTLFNAFTSSFLWFSIFVQARHSYYGCSNGEISDYFRQLVVDVHNQLRSSMAHGEEPNKCGLLSSGSNVYKLSYDCSLEESAWQRAKTCDLGYHPSSSYHGESTDLIPGLQVNTEEAITEVLLKWWSEAINNGVSEGNWFNTTVYNWAQDLTSELVVRQSNALLSCSSFAITPKSRLRFRHISDFSGHYVNSVVYTPGPTCRKDTDCTEHVFSTCEADKGLCVTQKPAVRNSSDTICNGNPNMTDEARLEILNWHNHLRSRLVNGLEIGIDGNVVPSGKNVYLMHYDCGLETSAQFWANQCNWSHSDVPFGENLYRNIPPTSYGLVNQMRLGALVWWNELRRHPLPNENLFGYDSLDIGHFSQMAWADSYRIGCGYAMNCTGSPPFDQFGYLVCHYIDQGNYINRRIYEYGEACTKDSDCTRSLGDTCHVETGLCIKFGYKPID